jgi:hypothetical protein
MSSTLEDSGSGRQSVSTRRPERLRLLSLRTLASSETFKNGLRPMNLNII